MHPSKVVFPIYHPVIPGATICVMTPDALFVYTGAPAQEAPFWVYKPSKKVVGLVNFVTSTSWHAVFGGGGATNGGGGGDNGGDGGIGGNGGGGGDDGGDGGVGGNGGVGGDDGGDGGVGCVGGSEAPATHVTPIVVDVDGYDVSRPSSPHPIWAPATTPPPIEKEVGELENAVAPTRFGSVQEKELFVIYHAETPAA